MLELKMKLYGYHNSKWQSYLIQLKNISLHIKNIFDAEELDKVSTVKEFLTVQQEENRVLKEKLKIRI